jgi:hypothetical protein
MGSLVAEQRIAVHDREGLVITPGNEPNGGPRESEVTLASGVVMGTPPEIHVALLVQANQRVERFDIKLAHGWQAATPFSDQASDDALRAWQHTSPNQQWLLFKVPVLIPPYHTRFKLVDSTGHKPGQPQEILWVAVRSDEGFAYNHRLYGWTQYPKP